MEGEVTRVASRLRGVYSDKLYEWRDQDKSQDAHRSTRRSRVFAPLQARKLGSPRAGSSLLAVDWKALLHAVFRRYAGELLVQGKLLNQYELLVHRIAWSRGQTCSQTERADVAMVIALPSHTMRFIVDCDDAPTTQIGSIVSATVVVKHARAFATAPVVSYRAEEAINAVWKDTTQQELLTMETVFGFDVAAFRIYNSRRHQRHYSEGKHRSDAEDEGDDEDDDERGCANATVVSDWTFSDLRGVPRMMEANGLSTTQWATLLQSDSGYTAAEERDPMSYISLGNAQKRMWSQERSARGDAMRAKGRLKDALTEYGSAIRLDDANVDALVQRGHVLVELRQYEDAIRDFESVQRIDPTHDEGIHGLLRAKGKLGHSKHVVRAARTRRSRSRSFEAKHETRARDRGRHHDHRPAALPLAASFVQEDAYSLEKERLRQLLEDEERQRKLLKRTDRKRNRSVDSSDTTDSDTKSKRSRRKKSSKSHKKSKKSKKTDRKQQRKSRSKSREDGKSEQRHKRSRSEASSGNGDSSRHHKREHRSRSRTRSRTRSRSHATT